MPRSHPRTTLSALLFALPVLLCAQLAAAQTCHAPSLRPTAGVSYRAALQGTFASFQTAAARGEYQGLLANFTLAHPLFDAEVALPAYRIAQAGSHAYGLGDLVIAARAHVYHSESDGLTAGPELAATLPTGREQDSLGMGHVMLMPGAFLRLQDARFALVAEVSYGRALGSAGAHHHMGPMPIVNPMNRSELAHALGISTPLHANVRASLRLLGAVPVFDHAGSAREIVAPGLQIIAGAFDVSLELQFPVLGRPFASRSVINVGAQW